jgi:hypothetical protein
MFNLITIILINHPIMTWKMGDSVIRRIIREKRKITGGRYSGLPRLIGAIDDVEFFPLA